MNEDHPPRGVTEMLRAWGAGDKEALDRLTDLVYKELRRMAHRYISGEKSGQTLQTSALVNELYLRLVDVRSVDLQDRAHFFALCARMMRHILIDFARSRQYEKRGGGAIQISLDEAPLLSADLGSSLVALDDALNGLAEMDPRKGQVVELRFFGGLSVEETAEALKVSPETVKRDWKAARAWLGREMSKGTAHDA
jgi:RNA polymerase sigma-70 factor (ECF subfamily)